MKSTVDFVDSSYSSLLYTAGLRRGKLPMIFFKDHTFNMYYVTAQVIKTDILKTMQLGSDICI